MKVLETEKVHINWIIATEKRKFGRKFMVFYKIDIYAVFKMLGMYSSVTCFIQ